MLNKFYVNCCWSFNRLFCMFVCDADSEWQLQNGCIPLTCQEQRPQYRSMSSQEVEKMSSQEVENKFSLFSLLRERKSRLSQKKELNSNPVTTNDNYKELGTYFWYPWFFHSLIITPLPVALDSSLEVLREVLITTLSILIAQYGCIS